MGLFSKKKTDDDNGAATKTAETFQRDPRKAKRFFEHAASVADHDYAIDCYINGLRHDPDNLDMHEALFELGKRRKVSGGRPMGFRESMSSLGKDPIARMLDAEKRWAKDPTNVMAMLMVMERAVEADESLDGDLAMAQVADWVGHILLDFNANSKKPSLQIFIKARDLFRQIESFSNAIEACKYAVRMDEDNPNLLQELKDLEAEKTMYDGGLIKAAKSGEGGFRDVIKDADEQAKLAAGDNLSGTEQAQQVLIENRKAEYEEAPDDLNVLVKYVEALRKTEKDVHETEAIRLLKEAWEKSGQYKFKVQMGDIIIRQTNRKLRNMQKQLAENPDPKLKEERDRLYAKLMKFELDEFTERVKNYPTDMKLKYQLGRRLFVFQKYDEAIGNFQEARADPKVRAASLLYLGKCYQKLEYSDEAIDAFRQGLDAHPVHDDATGLELRYDLMDALETAARKKRKVKLAEEAREIASALFQSDINFRDIRDRLGGIRKLVEELQTAGG